MKNKIQEKFIDGEVVYLKKGKFGYRVVHPIKNKDGSINYVNLFFGGKENLLRVIVYIVIALLLYVGIKQLIGSYEIIANNPCEFCKDCFSRKVIGGLPSIKT